jgi:hypothetical protein
MILGKCKGCKEHKLIDHKTLLCKKCQGVMKRWKNYIQNKEEKKHKFWNPKSGLLGGLICGAILGAIILLFAALY